MLWVYIWPHLYWGEYLTLIFVTPTCRVVELLHEICCLVMGPLSGSEKDHMWP